MIRSSRICFGRLALAFYNLRSLNSLNLDGGQWVCTDHHLQRKLYLVSACLASSYHLFSVSILSGAQAFTCASPLKERAHPSSSKLEHRPMDCVVFASSGTFSVSVIALRSSGCCEPPSTLHFPFYLSGNRC